MWKESDVVDLLVACFNASEIQREVIVLKGAIERNGLTEHGRHSLRVLRAALHDRLEHDAT